MYDIWYYVCVRTCILSGCFLSFVNSVRLNFIVVQTTFSQIGYLKVILVDVSRCRRGRLCSGWKKLVIGLFFIDNSCTPFFLLSTTTTLLFSLSFMILIYIFQEREFLKLSYSPILHWLRLSVISYVTLFEKDVFPMFNHESDVDEVDTFVTVTPYLSQRYLLRLPWNFILTQTFKKGRFSSTSKLFQFL